MKRHVYLPALLLTAALLVGCGHKAQPDTDTDPNAQAALPPEGITALVLSDDTQVLRFRRADDIWYWQEDETFPVDFEFNKHPRIWSINGETVKYDFYMSDGWDVQTER